MQLIIWNIHNGGVFPIYISPQIVRNKKNRIDFDVPEPSIRSFIYYADQISEIGDELPTTYWCQFIDKIMYYHVGTVNQSSWIDFYKKMVELKNNAELKGVIIDLRNYQGGSETDFHYLLGFLHSVNPKDGFHRSGWIRVKTGLGRYDYSPKIMKFWSMDSDYQMNITNIPIVILSNSHTASCGEQICYAAKQLDNGCVIGMRTFGALSPLTKGGNFLGGESGRNSNFYLVMANGAWFTDDGEILEGKGVTPDIEVQLDVEAFESTGRDTQLERALEYIRTGK